MAGNTLLLGVSSQALAKETNSKLNLPLVSIIICGHNYGQYFPDAIESALRQTYKRIEIVAVDDGSDDNTQEIFAGYGITRIYQKYQGLAAARNNGIRNSSGDFFLCLDGDDKISSKYIEETMKKMLRNPRIGFVTTGSRIWYEENGFENVWMPRKLHFRYQVFAGWVAALGTVLTRRDAYESLSSGFDESLPAHEDLDICFRLLKHWKSELVFRPLHWYRRHKVVLDSQTIETRRTAEMCLNRKYPHRQLYRDFHKIYKATVGRFVSFGNHPLKYLRAMRLKIQLTVQLRGYNHRAGFKTREYVKQLFDTLDMQVELSCYKDLFSYYEKRVEALRSMIFD